MHPLLVPSSHAELDLAARELTISGYYPNDQSDCYLKMLLGVSLGLTIFESLHGITFQLGAEGKPGKVIVEPFVLIERVVGRTDGHDVKVVTSSEDSCELNFFLSGKIKGQLTLTKAELEDKGLSGLTLTRLFQITYAQGVQKFFPHLFGHKFYLRAELPLTKQEHVKAIVEQSGSKVVTADQLAVTKRPGGKGALTADAKKLMDWKDKLKLLSATDPVQWDTHAEEMNTFTFLTSAQLDDLFRELCEFGRSQGIEFSGLNQHFFLADDVLAS